jgi:hypothetical protein
MNRATSSYQVFFILVFMVAHGSEDAGHCGIRDSENGMREKQWTRIMSYKSRRKKRKGQSGSSGSFVTDALAKLAREARAQAQSPSCASPDQWLKRANKLESARGVEAVGLYNVKTRPDFWDIVDQMTPKIVAKKVTSPRSGPSQSMKSGLHALREKARKKAIEEMCRCPPWGDCLHTPERDGGVWSERYVKLKSLTMEAALALLPHLGSQGIWDEVDRLCDGSASTVVAAQPLSIDRLDSVNAG